MCEWGGGEGGDLQVHVCISQVPTYMYMYLCILYYLPVSKGVHVALHLHAPSDQVLHYFLALYLSFLIPPSSLLTDTSHWLPLIGLHFLEKRMKAKHKKKTVDG